MKRLLTVLVCVVVISLSLYSVRASVLTGCQLGIEYSVGDVSDEFDIDRDKVVEISDQAAQVWNQVVGQEVISYDQGSEFMVDFIFDERQQETINRQRSELGIDSGRDQIDQLAANLELDRRDFKSLELSFIADRERYQAAQREFNNDVRDATPAKRDDLEARRVELEAWYRSIETKRSQLNQTASRLNSQASEFNRVVREFNDQVVDFNEQFGNGDVFRQGVYTGNNIEIYQYENESDLMALLVHEFGHALGIGHVDDPMAVMYYLQHEEQNNRINLTNDDIAALAKVCREEGAAGLYVNLVSVVETALSVLD